MEEINNKFTNKLRLTNKINPRDSYTKLSYNLENDKINKSERAKSLLNFINPRKKIIFKSFFDQRGAKKFLAEKEKAMEEFILIDELEDENKNEKEFFFHYFHYSSKRIKSHNKKSKKNFISNKKILFHKSDANLKSINNIGRINQKINKKKISKFESIKSKYSNIKSKDNSNLMMGENDSFIFTIISEMDNFKN